MFASNSPIFGMKTKALSARELGTEVKDMNGVELGYQLITAYHHALLRATIIAAGSEVVTISDDQKDSKNVKRNYPFVRDPVVTLPDQKLMLYTEGNKQYGAMDILATVKDKMGYEAIEVKDAYFEGGNTFYSPHKKVFLHGLHPCGYYEPEYLSSYRSNYKIDYYKVAPAQTNKQLAEVLAPHGISVYGLELNSRVINEKKGALNRYVYYHLDCFMQLLPDGRMLILNKKILSKSSQNKMQEIFGDDFIDLAYPDYLSEPVLFNFIALQNNDKTSVISPTLPKSVVTSLRNLNLNVITPDMLDSNSPAYDKEFSGRVAVELQQEGYKTATAENLTTHIPKNLNGYHLDNGDELPAEIKDTAAGAYWVPLDKYYSEADQRVSFNCGSGGPHCLTADIVPSVVMQKPAFTLPPNLNMPLRFFSVARDYNLGEFERIRARHELPSGLQQATVDEGVSVLQQVTNQINLPRLNL